MKSYKLQAERHLASIQTCREEVEELINSTEYIGMTIFEKVNLMRQSQLMNECSLMLDIFIKNNE